MDIVGHLARTVSPAVLGDDNSPAKNSLLEQFYAIFAARLAEGDTYQRFANDTIAGDDQGFYDRVWTDAAYRDQMSRELAATHKVDAATAGGLVAMAAPLAFNEIKSLAGDTPVPQFLNANMTAYQHHIPAWAGVGIVAAAPAGAHVPETLSVAPLVREEPASGSFMKALLPIIGLIILGALAWALLRGCQDHPTPVGTPEVTEEQVVDEQVVDEQVAVIGDVEPASLHLATDDANTLYACSMNVGDTALQTVVLDAMTTAFGDEANKCRAEVNNDFATDMPAAPVLAAILSVIQTTPNASMVIQGDQIVVNSPDAAALEALVSDLQAVAPSMTVSAEAPLNLQDEIEDSLAAAGAALDKLGDTPDPSDVARALSLQVVNFELDKAFIPDANKRFLDRAVDIITNVPNMALMIIGHTDSQASDAYNLELSRARAESMREYLIAQGVDANKLKVKGMGESEPIADNETEQGRFRNRRIEFVVYNESTMSADAVVTAPDAPDLNPQEANDATQGTPLDPQ